MNSKKIQRLGNEDKENRKSVCVFQKINIHTKRHRKEKSINHYISIYNDILYNSKYMNKSIEINTFDEFQNYLTSLINTFELHKTIPNERLNESNQEMLRTSILKNTEIEDFIDKEGRGLKFSDHNCKITSLNTLKTVIGSTGLINGKHCFEIIPLTVHNKMIRVGFTQKKNTFTEGEGIGDNEYSFGFDLNTQQLHHCFGEGKKIIEYGETLGEGDVLGVCIDLTGNAGAVEFYKNGDSLNRAISFPIGGDIMYYPAVTMEKGAEIFLNFGGERNLCYKYPPYKKVDKPLSKRINLIKLTEGIFDILRVNGMKLLLTDKIDMKIKKDIFGKILYYLVFFICKQSYLIRKYFIPFLIENFQENHKLIEYFSFVKDDNREFIGLLFNDLCYDIEYYSYRQNFIKWKNLVTLFINLLKVKSISTIWIEGNETTKHLTCVFHPYIFNALDQYISTRQYLKDILRLKPKDNISRKKIAHFYKKFLNEMDDIGLPNYNAQYDVFSELLSVMIDEEYNKKYSIILDNYTYETENLLQKDKNLRNFMITNFISLIELFRKCLNEQPKDYFISLEPILNPELYLKDEEVLGGSFSYVSEILKRKIPNYLQILEKKPTKIDKVFYIIISFFDYPMSLFFEDMVNEFELFSGIQKQSSLLYKGLGQLFIDNKLLFNKDANEKLLWFAEYTIDFYTKLIDNNMIFFFEDTFCIFPMKLLRLLGSKKGLTKSNVKIVPKIANFLINLLKSPMVRNPDTKEILFKQMINIFKYKKCQTYLKNQELLIQIFNIIISLFNSDSEGIILEFCTKIFFKTNKYIKIPNFTKTIITLFKNNKELFTKFLENFNNLLNTIMTTFLFKLNECSSSEDFNIIEFFLRFEIISTMKLLLEGFNQAISIFKFFTENFSFILKDSSSLEFHIFLSFVVNLSNRVLSKDIILKLEKQNEKFCDKEFSLLLIKFYKWVINFLLIIKRKFSNNLIEELAKQKEVNFNNFLFFEYIYTKANITTNSKLDEYTYFIDKLKHIAKNINAKKVISQSDNDNICIICLDKDTTHHFNPCNHGCCLICLKQYILQKDFCFLCKSKIENIKEDNTIIINHN